jgi:serine/threonine protein kinase
VLVQSDSRRDPLIGIVVHNYVIRKRLAEGGMGAVYLAEHQDPRSASKKVIKVLLPEFSKHPVIGDVPWTVESRWRLG